MNIDKCDPCDFSNLLINSESALAWETF